MNKQNLFQQILILQIQLIEISCWHDLGNTDFHCWPLSASSQNPVPFSTCPGINIKWILPPPAEIKAGKAFNVTYDLTFDSEFWTWAVSSAGSFKLNFFASSNGGITDPVIAQKWCENTACPDDSKAANQENCCIHHVNVHSCPLAEVELVKNGLCGPWIPSSGSIFTHSKVMIGSSSIREWTSQILGLYTVGETSLIAHFKVGELHIALEKSIEVLPKTICGDDKCEEEETCSTCPKDCGRCPLKGYQIALIAVAAGIIVSAFLTVIGYSKYKERKLLWDESWILDYDIIVSEAATKHFVPSCVSLKSGNSGGVGNIDSQLFTPVGIYEGKMVAVKNLIKSDFVLSKLIRQEVKNVRQLDHPNLVKFVGGCINLPNIALITEYCPKGALSDLLQSESTPLNWSFRFSFSLDIAGAMSYLHSKNVIHGRLKSSNCVIDDRWSVRVSDYGLETYRSEESEKENEKRLKDVVYIAPEVCTNGTRKSFEADVYAFGIILIEIATRQDPYGEEDFATVKIGWKPSLPDLSNKVYDEDVKCPSPVEYNKLIQECYSNTVSERPTFDIIKKKLKKMNPDRRSPVDMMMLMMEKYSKHLESLVADRTSDLEQEKLKTDRLLYSMLPRAVADELRHGRIIGAEQYSACTIYFSDIVGFTNLSGNSTPMQVVGLLNKLYTCFDSIIDNFDVYKVETIGDAYMVVSGVPVRNGKEHASQIALMSIQLVNAAKSFVIPHMPGEPLKIRVGLHSGPVCAGVVGLKMPRYCLFGDTVNTASRMESNGQAYRIHISLSTYEILEEFGNFDCEFRGTLEIKEK
ncbi:DgyrCDS2637 [Dimorphilus gyrociliatus]|uniref:Guanylate cyclase n=1 Tax=Dimorphilus gyrociliatus TaxID=2664684 RepID=A0A7I8VC67_9ANNE|nr:DgyrCDS2637 [Dimorphilus gyrociliatus]